MARPLTLPTIPPMNVWGPALWRGFWSYLKKMGTWFIPMIITAGATAWLSYHYNQKSNTELAVQQQRYSDLQSFRNSGSDLDQSVTALSDALVDGRGIEEARSKLRIAITRHLSDATANEATLGSGVEPYEKGLGELRRTVDAVDRDSTDTGIALWEQSLQLMSQRRKLVNGAMIKVAG